MLKSLYIHTIGCQMNVYDARRMAAKLHPLGYQLVADEKKADLIIVNTCSIREKAEQKVFSYLGRLAGLKKNKDNPILAVGGCVAQQEGRKILKRVPHVNLVFGTHAINRLPGLIRAIEKGQKRLVDVEMLAALEETEASPQTFEKPAISRFVTIMQGCDNYCTYCVVPFVRGPEMSRQPQAILNEIKILVGQGVREVTLLGQNVNSYGRKENTTSFAALLKMVDTIEGLKRVRFTTSHPKDLSSELISCFGSLEKLCRHIHLPVQSGANRILKRMNRKYTRKLYLERIAALRQQCPDIAITSDFIVGFPGETDAEFGDTLDLIREVGYDGLFAFAYSDRPLAPARHYHAKVPETLKKQRLQELLSLQNAITLRKNKENVGRTVTVLLEGLSATNGSGQQWSGRTSQNKIVNFHVNEDLQKTRPAPGDSVAVKIEVALAHSLKGLYRGHLQDPANKGTHHAT